MFIRFEHFSGARAAEQAERRAIRAGLPPGEFSYSGSGCYRKVAWAGFVPVPNAEVRRIFERFEEMCNKLAKAESEIGSNPIAALAVQYGNRKYSREIQWPLIPRSIMGPDWEPQCRVFIEERGYIRNPSSSEIAYSIDSAWHGPESVAREIASRHPGAIVETCHNHGFNKARLKDYARHVLQLDGKAISEIFQEAALIWTKLGVIYASLLCAKSELNRLVEIDNPSQCPRWRAVKTS